MERETKKERGASRQAHEKTKNGEEHEKEPFRPQAVLKERVLKEGPNVPETASAAHQCVLEVHLESRRVEQGRARDTAEGFK